MTRPHLSPLRFGISGLVCYAASVAWVAISDYLAHRTDPPGWIREHPNPIGAYYLGGLGGLIVLAALIWAVSRWANRRG
jgi:hypothetical protein